MQQRLIQHVSLNEDELDNLPGNTHYPNHQSREYMVVLSAAAQLLILYRLDY